MNNYAKGRMMVVVDLLKMVRYCYLMDFVRTVTLLDLEMRIKRFDGDRKEQERVLRLNLNI